MNLQHYLQYHRRYEVLLWVGYVLISVCANSIVVNLDLSRLDLGFATWEPWVWEGSSGLVVLLLLPLVLALNRRFPLFGEHWRRNALIHVFISVLFSLIHVAGMVALRKLVYWMVGGYYDFGPLLREWLYEYLKDFRGYAYVLAVVYSYDFILNRLQGEASLPGENEESPNPAEHFLVKKLGKEFLVKISDIDWLEAAGNYVTLHAKGHRYPLRGTMTSLEQRLSERGFARVHRSAMVNLDRVVEIEPLDSGDARARLHDDQWVPISRRYRSRLKERLEA